MAATYELRIEATSWRVAAGFAHDVLSKPVNETGLAEAVLQVLDEASQGCHPDAVRHMAGAVGALAIAEHPGAPLAAVARRSLEVIGHLLDQVDRAYRT